MLKSFVAMAAVAGFLAVGAAPAFAGPGCGSSTTAHSGGSLEVAQTDQVSKPLPQTKPAQTTTQ